MDIEPWMITKANEQLRKPLCLGMDSQAQAKKVYAEREYVMSKVPLEVPKGFALMVAKQEDLHFIASPTLSMEDRAEEQLFYVNLRSIALCHSFGMEFIPVDSLFLMTSLGNGDLMFDEFIENMS